MPLTGRGGVNGFAFLRMSYCQDNWLTDGGDFVIPTRNNFC
jgi:hypothetical protein